MRRVVLSLALAGGLAAVTAAGPLSERIWFVAKGGSVAKIFRVRIDGKELARLTHEPGQEREPDVSLPAGAVAFRSNRDGNPEIYRCSMAGKDFVRLTHSDALDREPSWSPDGQHIAFSTARWGEEEIAVMDGARGDEVELKRLTRDLSSSSDPSWSPDGRWIAFSGYRQGQADIYIVSPDGKELRRLTRDWQPDVTPRWSPDSHKIVYQTQRGPRNLSALAIFDLDTQSIQVLSAIKEIADCPAWSPDGSSILFVGSGTRLAPRPRQMQIYNLATGVTRAFELSATVSGAASQLTAEETLWTNFPLPW